MAETSFSQASPLPVEEGQLTAGASMATLTNYLWTIIYMPNSLRQGLLYPLDAIVLFSSQHFEGSK